MGLKFCSDFFWVRDFCKDFLRGLTKRETQGSRSFLIQTIVSFSFTKERWMQKLLLFFLIGLFLGYVLGRWTFFGPGSSLKDFFGSNNFASFAHPRH